MAGLIGPADRWVYTVGPNDALKAIKNRPAKMFLDEALTVAAPIRTTLDDLIEESTVTTDVFSRWPLFRFPVIDDVQIDTLFTSIAGGPVVALYARPDDQIDALRIAVLEAQADAAEDATTKADAAAAAGMGAAAGLAIVFGGI